MGTGGVEKDWWGRRDDSRQKLGFDTKTGRRGGV